MLLIDVKSHLLLYPLIPPAVWSFPWFWARGFGLILSCLWTFVTSALPVLRLWPCCPTDSLVQLCEGSHLLTSFLREHTWNCLFLHKGLLKKKNKINQLPTREASSPVPKILLSWNRSGNRGESPQIPKWEVPAESIMWWLSLVYVGRPKICWFLFYCLCTEFPSLCMRRELNPIFKNYCAPL